MRVPVAVIPAAGRGTRMRPATRSVPKALLPVVDRPVIQWIVEEGMRAGVREFVVVVSPGVDDLLYSHFEGMGSLEELQGLEGITLTWVTRFEFENLPPYILKNKLLGKVVGPGVSACYDLQDKAEDPDDPQSSLRWFVIRYDGADVETLMRQTLGRLLFGGDDVKKPVRVISGGEQGRMIFGKLMLLNSNVLVLDEPTNHLDMESIESLNTALEKYEGTLVFVSHDREFVSSLATRILEIKQDGSYVDYRGDYDEYLHSLGVE